MVDRSLVIYAARRNPTPEPLFRLYGQLAGVQVTHTIDSVAPIGARLEAERDAPRADIVITKTRFDMEVLRRKGILAPHCPAPAAALAEWLHDPAWSWCGFSGWPRLAIVNRTQLPDSAAWPMRIEDFTEPRFRGQFACASILERTTRAQFAALAAVKGIPAMQDLLRRLMANGMIVRTGNTGLRKEMMATPFAAALASASNVHVFRLQGNAVDMAWLDQGPGDMGTHVEAHTAALVADAPHADEGRRFLDWLVGAEAQGFLAQLYGETPVNPAAPHFDVRPLAAIHRIAAPVDEGSAIMDAVVAVLREGGLANPEDADQAA